MSECDKIITLQDKEKKNGKYSREVFFLTLVWCFFLPFKFGDMVCVPDAPSVLPFTFWEWLLNNWGDAFFALVSSVLLLLSILFPASDTVLNRRQFLYCCGFGGIFLLSFIGIINARGIDYPAGEMVHIGGAFAFLLLIANTAGGNREKCTKILKALAFGWFILLLAGCYQYFCGFDSMKDYLAEQEAAGIKINDELRARLLDERLTGGCGSSAALAALLLVLSPPALLLVWQWAKTFQPPRPSQLLLTGITGFTALGAFLLTRSRAAFLAAVAAAVITAWSRITSLRIRLLTALAAAAVILAGAWYIATAGRGFGSMAARADYYAASAKMLAANPVTGTGWGGFADNYMKMKVLDLSENARDPHSMLATLGSQAGILPLLAGILWLAFLFVSLLQKTAGAGDKDEKLRMMLFIFALSSFWLHAQMDFLFQITSTLSAALAVGFIALQGGGQPEACVQMRPAVRAGTAIFAAAAIICSALWLRAEYSYTEFHNKISQVPPALPYETGKAFRHCISARPCSAFVYLAAGNDFMAKRDFAGAEQAYKEAIKINPDNYSAYGQLAKIAYLKRDIKAAKEWAEKCLQLNPYHTSSLEIVAESP